MAPAVVALPMALAMVAAQLLRVEEETAGQQVGHCQVGAALYAAVPGLYKEENKTADVTQFRQSLTDNDIQ